MRVRAVPAAALLAFVVCSDAMAQSRTSSIAGRVIQPDGAAAENARVAVYEVHDAAENFTLAGTAISSYDGRYEVTGLPAGIFLIGVTPEAVGPPTPRGVARPSAAETFYPDVVDGRRAHRVTVLEGVPAEGIDIWLAPAPQRYTVSGRVFLPDGLDVRELVIEYGGPDVIRRGIWYVYDPGGLFEIEGVAQGPLVMLARAETDRGLYMGVASTEITVESVQDVRIAMRPPGRIEGRVVFEGRRPAGDLRLVPVQTLLKLSALYPIQETPIPVTGRFEIPDALGTYAFEVRGLPAGWTVKRVVRAAQSAPDNRVTVGSEERLTGVEIVVGPGAT